MAEMVLTSKGAAVSRNDPAFRRTLLLAVIVCASYYLTSKIGFAFALQPGSVSILWMPNSILLAALLLSPRRWWWLILLAAVPAHFASELQSGVPTRMVLSWFVSNSVQALLGAFCITQLVDGPLRFDRVRDLTVFVIFGAFLAPFLSSFLDIALVKLNSWGDNSYWEIWRIRCLSNVLATLTLVPVAVLWVTGSSKLWRKVPVRRFIEPVLLMIGLFAVGFFVFTSHQGIADRAPSLLYWPLPFLLWAAVRFGPRGVTSSLLVVMFLAISGATHGEGPFVASSSVDNALSIQWFLIVMAVPLMTLAAVIEERRRAENSARENEERLTMALNAARMGSWDWQISENRLTWPENTRRVFGPPTSDPDTTLESFFTLVHPDDRASVESALAGAIGSGGPYEIEFRMTNQGTTRWVLSKGKVLYDDAGRPTRMLGLGIDITERKRAEEALRQTESRLTRTEAFSLVMVTHVGLDGRWLKVPRTLCELLGYSEEELLSGGFKDVTHSDDFEAYWSQCLRLIRGEIRSFDLEKRYLHKNGSTIWVYVNCSIVEDDQGTPVHLLTYIRDITDRKRAEQALLESNERLIESNQQIRALAARLITAQESERRRISLLLHDDVSQKIAALGVVVSRLKRKLPTSNIDMGAELNQFGIHLNDLTTQIRHLSHQLHPEVLEHLGLVAALESVVREFGHDEGIELSFKSRVQSEPISLELSTCLYHVAFEAMRNISKHSNASSGTISLAEDEGFLTLEVSDSGRGFDVERAKRGSGIGLISAEERVKVLCGTFEVSSTPHQGTTIVARVPLGR